MTLAHVGASSSRSNESDDSSEATEGETLFSSSLSYPLAYFEGCSRALLKADAEDGDGGGGGGDRDKSGVELDGGTETACLIEAPLGLGDARRWPGKWCMCAATTLSFHAPIPGSRLDGCAHSVETGAVETARMDAASKSEPLLENAADGPCTRMGLTVRWQ